VECSAGRLARAFLGGNFEKPEHRPSIRSPLMRISPPLLDPVSTG
jgi:hypothetical protein